MPIQMIGAQTRTAQQLCHAEDPRAANQRSMDGVSGGVGDLFRAEGTTGRRCSEVVRLPDGSMQQRAYQPGLANHLGAALNHRQVDDLEAFDPAGVTPETPGVAADAPAIEGLLAPDGPGSTIDTGA